jgi:hypothetical protein
VLQSDGIVSMALDTDKHLVYSVVNAAGESGKPGAFELIVLEK